MSVWTCVSSYAYKYDLEVGGIYYTVNISKRTATIVAYPGATGKVVIPDEIVYNTRHLKVTGIGDSAFEGNKNITSVSCKEPKYIGKSSFKNCSNLVSLQMPIVIDDSVPEYAFYSCTNLKYIPPFEGGYSNIESFAFCGCKSLKRLTIPGTVSHIGSGAFYNFRAEHLTIEAGDDELQVSDVWEGGILSADTIYWKRSNTVFKGYKGTVSARVFVLGESVQKIPKNLFATQKVITLLSEPAPTAVRFDASTYLNTPLCVPSGSLEKYQNQSGWWSNFFVMTEENYVSGIGQVRAESSNRPLYDIEGVKVGRTNKGLNIVRCSDGKLRKVMMAK